MASECNVPRYTRHELKNQGRRGAELVKSQRIQVQNNIVMETSCEQSNVSEQSNVFEGLPSGFSIHLWVIPFDGCFDFVQVPWNGDGLENEVRICTS